MHDARAPDGFPIFHAAPGTPEDGRSFDHRTRTTPGQNGPDSSVGSDSMLVRCCPGLCAVYAADMSPDSTRVRVCAWMSMDVATRLLHGERPQRAYPPPRLGLGPFRQVHPLNKGTIAC